MVSQALRNANIHIIMFKSIAERLNGLFIWLRKIKKVAWKLQLYQKND